MDFSNIGRPPSQPAANTNAVAPTAPQASSSNQPQGIQNTFGTGYIYSSSQAKMNQKTLELKATIAFGNLMNQVNSMASDITNALQSAAYQTFGGPPINISSSNTLNINDINVTIPVVVMGSNGKPVETTETVSIPQAINDYNQDVTTINNQYNTMYAWAQKNDPDSITFLPKQLGLPTITMPPGANPNAMTAEQTEELIDSIGNSMSANNSVVRNTTLLVSSQQQALQRAWEALSSTIKALYSSTLSVLNNTP